MTKGTLPPYIGAPMSSDPLTILYAENIETALISGLDSLDVDMFFTLTLFHAPTLDEGGLVAPLITFWPLKSLLQVIPPR